MNTYHAFYRGKKIELTADSSYDAQEKAAKLMKARKSYEVAIMLAALGPMNETYVHHPASL